MPHPMLDCQESGHWWPTNKVSNGLWLEARAKTGQKILVREQTCQRFCGRIKITKIYKSTYQLFVKPTYKWLDGKPDPIGTRVKSQLRAMQLEEQ